MPRGGLYQTLQDTFPSFDQPEIETCCRRNQGGARVIVQTAGRLQFDFHFSRVGNRRIGAIEWAEGKRWSSRCQHQAQPN